MGSFEIIEHTADVGIRATGDSLEECFAEAARGMINLVTDLNTVQEKKSFRIRVEADDLERLLYDFLSEVLYLHHVEFFLFSRFELKITRDEANLYLLEGTGTGEEFDPTRQRWEEEIKAVTFHGLQVLTEPDHLVEVLFDI